MAIRTYLRTLFNDIFKHNIFAKTVAKIVNFYCKLWFKDNHALKFDSNIPIKGIEKKYTVSFLSVTGDKVDCK